MGRLYGFAYWFCNISRPPAAASVRATPRSFTVGEAKPGGRLCYVFGTLFFSHCHRIRKPMPAAIQEEI